MYLCLFEDDRIAPLLPLVHTRAVYDLRLGIRTLLETARDAFDRPPTLLHTRPEVEAVTAAAYDALVNNIPDGLDVLFVNGRYVAEAGPLLERLRQVVCRGEEGRVFVQGADVVAAWVPRARASLVRDRALTRASFDALPEEPVSGAQMIGRLWDLIDGLHPALIRDYEARVSRSHPDGSSGADVQDGAILAGREQIYLAPGATIRPGAILNATEGPIYVGKRAVVMEGAVVRGPAYIGRYAQVKVGASLEGCAVGPWSKAGGEVNTAVLHSYSNKAHAGFLGHSYLGSWCNIGAGTNSSNLRNDYGPVSLYNAASGVFEPSSRQFLGLIMGDHAKCGINTMFNTGTVVGVSCNLFGAGFHPRYVPSFLWGSPSDGYTTYRLSKACEVAEQVMARRQRSFTAAERTLLEDIYEATAAERANGIVR